MLNALARFGTLAVILAGGTACTAPLDSAGAAGGPERAESDEVAARTAAIVDGRPDLNNHPAVVLLVNVRRGSQCTGIIVAPKAVLTAKHCVQGSGNSADSPGSFRVYTGGSQSTLIAEYRVSEVLAAPGAWDIGSGDETDVAMLILSTAAREAPMEISYDSASVLSGRTITAIGYGQTPSGTSGVKMRTDKRVQQVLRNMILVEPAVCQGDSGGPVVGADGRIYGVASFIFEAGGRTAPVCGTALGVYNGWADESLKAFIRGGIERSGSCAPSGPEVCDGVDNDCNDQVDEVCTPRGEPCATDDECAGGMCGDTPIGRICTEACLPLTPEIGCGIDFYCARTAGCDGLCVPREEPVGGAPLGNAADCSVDSDCASLFCSDPGDGRRRCLTPCEGDAGGCISGEVCAALPGACGGCVPAGLVTGLRGAGEPCVADAECHSMMCFADEGISYCSSDCTADGDCGDAFHCRSGACARGTRGGLGVGCVTNDDCDSSAPICAVRGTVSWCTAICTDSCESAGFSCVDVGEASVCSPDGGLVGEPCDVAGDCVSGLCVNAGAGLVCTAVCSRERSCSAGFECTRTADGITNVCVAPVRARDGGGCSVSPVGRRRGTLFGFGLFALALVSALWRRRDR